MTWSKPEQKIMDEQGKSIEQIKTALLGNLETKEPGLIDDMRDTQHVMKSVKTELKLNRKQHLILYSLIGFMLLSSIYYALGGDPTNMVKWIGSVIVRRL